MAVSDGTGCPRRFAFLHITCEETTSDIHPNIITLYYTSSLNDSHRPGRPAIVPSHPPQARVQTNTDHPSS